VACGRDEVEGLDFMFARKIIRKFEALNLSFLQDEIDQLMELMDNMFGKDAFEESKAYLEVLKRSY
jgi:TRAP-type C4-dicarboxylate transport system substrate-binding protein